MFTKPVSICDLPSIISYSELPQTILVPSLERENVIIKPSESGWENKQIFTSSDLPIIMKYEFFRLVKSPMGRVYPRYKANNVIKEELWLEGRNGYNNGRKIIDRIISRLIWQAEMFEADSINWLDLKFFDYTKEKFSYWVTPSSSYFYDSDNESALGYVCSDKIYNGYDFLFDPDGYGIRYGANIRPAITLALNVIDLPKGY